MIDIGNSSRWFEMPEKVLNHKIQSQLKADLLSEKYRNYTIVAGRRSYKTERFLKRLFVFWSETQMNKVHYLGSPTHSQSKAIFWSDIKLLSHKALIKKISEVELKITYNNNTTLQVVGLNEFRRVQGGFAHKVGITEFQECNEAVFSESFEPMLNDVNGVFIGECRPLGKNHVFDDYQKGIRGVEGYGSYHWKASDILSDKQIIRAKKDLAENDYNREYNASFDTLTGCPYYSYSDKNHFNYEYDSQKPVIVTCDFNATIKPMTSLIGQTKHYKGIKCTFWFKCLSSQFTNIEQQCKNLNKYFRGLTQYPKKMLLYGDYAGTHQTSNSSYNDWEIIEQYFDGKLEIEKKIKPCKSIRNSIGTTNAQLKNTLGEIRQYIKYDDCLELARDWEKCEWTDDSKELKEYNSGEGAKRGHACRSIDYYNDYEFPIIGYGTIRNL